MTKANIMIVEDEFVIAMETKSNLKNIGYEVTSIVDSGEKVIAKIKEDLPDLILMDIRIKGEMDGIEVAELIRSDYNQTIPLIFISAYADDEKLERAKLVYPSGYLVKPVQARELKAVIEMALYAGNLEIQRIKAEKELRTALAESKNKCDEISILLDSARSIIDNIQQISNSKIR